MSTVSVVAPQRLLAEAMAAALRACGLAAAVAIGPGDDGDAEASLIASPVGRRPTDLQWRIVSGPDMVKRGSSWADVVVTAPDVRSLVEVIERFLQGRGVSSKAGNPVAPPAPTLTERELDVLRLMAEGAGNADIADQLSISANTVRTHAQNILGKLGVNNRFAAVASARTFGLLDSPG